MAVGVIAFFLVMGVRAVHKVHKEDFRKQAEIEIRNSLVPTMRIYQATLNTLHGLSSAAKTEAAPRQEMIALALALPIGVLIAPNVSWYVAMIASLFALLAIELLNTAIERLADRVTMERDARIGMVKDFGSASVFCALCVAGLVWIAAAAVRFELL